MAVKRLRVALRNARAVDIIGGTLRSILRFDQVALKRREAVQLIGMHGAQYMPADSFIFRRKSLLIWN